MHTKTLGFIERNRLLTEAIPIVFLLIGMLQCQTAAAQSDHAGTLSAEAVTALSRTQVVPTITENGQAWAIGFNGQSVFRTSVQKGIRASFGISAGRLAAADEVGFKVIDLSTGGSERPFRGAGVIQAAWKPDGQGLAAIVFDNSTYRVVYYSAIAGLTEIAASASLYKSFLRWTTDGSAIFYAEVGAEGQSAKLARYSLSEGTRSERVIDNLDLPFLTIASDDLLNSNATELRYLASQPLTGKLGLRNQDRSAVIDLEGRTLAVAAAFRAPEGVLLYGEGELVGWNEQLLQPVTVERQAKGSGGTPSVTPAVAPANDDPPGAIVITTLPTLGVTEDTTQATSAGDPVPTCVSNSHTVWFKYVATFTGYLVIDTIGSSFDTTITVYDGTATVPNEVACNDDYVGLRSRVDMPIVNGHTYLIMLGRFSSGAGGSLTLNVFPGWNEAPAASSVTFPNSVPSGLGGTFTLRFTDPNGGKDITWIQMLVNTSLNSVAGCYIHYDIAGASLYLMKDDGVTFMGPLSTASASTLSNSRCGITGNLASASRNSHFLTVNINVIFYAAALGDETVWTRANDTIGQNTGWQNKGTYTVSDFPSVLFTQPQASFTGIGDTFRTDLFDPVNINNVAWAQILFNTSLVSSNGCYVHLDRLGNKMYLLGNDGVNFLGPITIGSGSLSNSQCTILGTGASVTLNSGRWVWLVPVTFTQSFGGAQTIFGRVTNTFGQTSTWRTVGSYTVSSAPSVSFVDPDNGSGSTQSFSLNYTDPNGFANIAWAQVLFNATQDSANACYVHIDRLGNAVYLQSNANSNQWFGPATPGTAVTLTNSQCSVNIAGVTFNPSGTDLEIIVPITFFPGTFSGARRIFMRVSDQQAQTSDWTDFGSYTVQ